ncbi:MAG: ribonuclease HII [Candidatus Omnitrophica bacterium]|nr:ribonuclease HII [Candidatus Omnitrophota bacterium]
MVVGIDEAGRGPLAGVVVACALHLRQDPPYKIKDSKAMSTLAREKVFSWLVENADFAVDIADPKEIDRLNILQATFLAFERSISKLISKCRWLSEADFIIDGNFFKTKLDINYRCLIGADRKVKEVSCASIIAKVVRDNLMLNLDFLYPEWKFSKHKGYPTKEHFSLIKKYSLTPFHRISFAPCRDIV